jgi:hypothetical protein
MPGKRGWQRLSKARTPNVHRHAARLEMMADATGGRALLVENEENRVGHATFCSEEFRRSVNSITSAKASHVPIAQS